MQSCSLCIQFAQTTPRYSLSLIFLPSASNLDLSLIAWWRKMYFYEMEIMKIGKIMFHIGSKREHNEIVCCELLDTSNNMNEWTLEREWEKKLQVKIACLFFPHTSYFPFRTNATSLPSGCEINFLYLYLFRCVYVTIFLMMINISDISGVRVGKSFYLLYSIWVSRPWWWK